MEDKIGSALFHGILERDVIVEVAVNKMDPLLPVGPFEKVFHIVQRTPPTAHAEDIPVCVYEEKFGRWDPTIPVMPVISARNLRIHGPLLDMTRPWRNCPVCRYR